MTSALRRTGTERTAIAIALLGAAWLAGAGCLTPDGYYRNLDAGSGQGGSGLGTGGATGAGGTGVVTGTGGTGTGDATGTGGSVVGTGGVPG
ncbi:MAG TPA: hypothetical protein VHO06_23470, partial [Polyangia bacterium]|nr:hypothetical protein [Polyangia bacterium]